MAYVIDDSIVYYFLCPVADKYHTLFLGWLREDLIVAFQTMKEEKGRAYIRLNVGVHQFINVVDKPLFLVDHEKEGIFEFASDSNELELFAGMEEPPELDMEPVVGFPSYFNKGIEPLLDFKLGDEFCINDNGVWVPLEL